MTIKLCFFNKLNRIRFNHKTLDLNPNLAANLHLHESSHINNHEYLLLKKEIHRIHTDIIENITVVNILICLILIILFHHRV